MSVPVALEALWEQVAAFGGHPYLITVGPEGKGHVVSVAVRQDGDVVRLRAGTSSRANLAANPTPTLLWPAPPGGEYSLIVDGEAEATDGDELSIRPRRAVLHRVAGADEALPSCVRLVDQR